MREAGGAAKRTARKSAGQAKRTARQARKVPGVARAEGTVKGAAASESDLAIASYDSLSADEVQDKLAELSQIDLAKVNAYERKNQNRSTVTSRIDSLQGDEPWPGYDELAVEEVRAVLSEGDDTRNQGRPQLRAQAQEPRRRAPGHRARAQQRLEPFEPREGAARRPPPGSSTRGGARTGRSARRTATETTRASLTNQRERAGWASQPGCKARDGQGWRVSKVVYVPPRRGSI